MNYYRRYVGSYLKKTTKITMVEDGAYTRLLDTYYADEKPLDPTEVYAIGRAMNSAERKAVDSVIAKYFYLGADGLLHNEKADEELGVAIPKIEKQKINGPINGSKGGRPKKPRSVPENNQGGLASETSLGSKTEPTRNQPSTVSHQPEAKPSTKERIPGDGDISGSAATLGAAALTGLKAKALTLDQAKIEGGEDTPAAPLAAVLFANGIKGNAFHPLVIEWAREGITVERLKDAIAKARQRPGKDKPGTFGCEYLDPILHDESKPAAQINAEKASHDAARSVAKANTVIEAGRAAAAAAAPMPDALKPSAT